MLINWSTKAEYVYAESQTIRPRKNVLKIYLSYKKKVLRENVKTKRKRATNQAQQKENNQFEFCRNSICLLKGRWRKM